MKKILLAALLALLPALAYAGTAKPVVLQNGQPANLPSGTTLQLNAGSTGAAPLNVGQGSAPSSPNNGDCWITSSGLFCRYNGSTVGPFGTGSGSGSVTTTGSPASGNLTKFSGSTSITNGDVSGDCTTSGTLAITCTKTSGTSFATSATTDTTNAANISSGTLPAGRMPALTGDVTSSSGSVATTVAKVNGTSVPSSPSTHQTPVVTSSNTATWKTIPDCTDTGGNHLNYTQSTDAYSCGTSSSGGGGSVGKVVYGVTPTTGNATSFASGFAVCTFIVLPNGGTIDRIGFMATAASASTNWRVAVYSDSSLSVNARQQQSNVVSAVVKGENVTSLTSAYSNSSGNDQSLWLCMATDTANFNIATTGTWVGALLWNNSGSTLPSTAPAQSSDSHGWVIFGFGSAGT